MKYVSTRGRAPALSFADVLLAGLADDQGLYVPEAWPDRHTPAIEQPYAAFAAEVMWPFVEGSIERDDFEQLTYDAYATFSHPDVIPITRLPDGMRLVELFWGPTLAFKDVAMQLLGRLFDYELAKRDTHVTIVGATSGDTGSAAIEAFRDRRNIDIVILHPHGRTSEVQRRQMTTIDAANVHNVAIDGTFDDCQDLVKGMFGDIDFRSRVNLAAVNSINWARVMGQVVYYQWAVARTFAPGQDVSVTVPTGNFGNIFAARVAKRLGTPISRFLVASNRNAVLTQFFDSGAMNIGPVEPSLSPSMDIQVSSNLERLIYELVGEDGHSVDRLLRSFRAEGQVTFPEQIISKMRENWHGETLTDPETLAVMKQVYEESGIVLDPHSAVGVGAARRHMDGPPQLVMATAHPAKFPDAVERATGIRPELPAHLADLLERQERFTRLPSDLIEVQQHISAQSG